jgi:hypothetical protein
VSRLCLGLGSLGCAIGVQARQGSKLVVAGGGEGGGGGEEE